MSALTLASIMFLCVFASALLGMFLRAILPRHHLSEDSKDVVKVSMGLVATMVALILGLLTASAKSTYDTQNSEVQHAAANVIRLDRTLANYGPETRKIREELRQAVALRLRAIWPENSSTPISLDPSKMTPTVERLIGQIISLTPHTVAQQEYKSQALQTVYELGGLRWLVYTQVQNQIPITFLVVLLFWLAILFVSFGLFAPANPTVVSALVVCALAVSIAIFLIREMNEPFQGLIKIPSTPLQNALSQLGR